MNEDFEPYGPFGEAGPAISAVMAIWLLLAIIGLFFAGPWPLALWFVAHVALTVVSEDMSKRSRGRDNHGRRRKQK